MLFSPLILSWGGPRCCIWSPFWQGCPVEILLKCWLVEWMNGRKEKRKEERKNERKKLKCFCSLLPPPPLLTHHPASRYARGHSGLASLGILIELFSSDKVNRQGNFYTILLSFGHQVFDYLGSLFIKQRSANLYTGAKIKISLYTKNMINSQSR